jgi:hypothetical protein
MCWCFIHYSIPIVFIYVPAMLWTCFPARVISTVTTASVLIYRDNKTQENTNRSNILNSNSCLPYRQHQPIRVENKQFTDVITYIHQHMHITKPNYKVNINANPPTCLVNISPSSRTKEYIVLTHQSHIHNVKTYKIATINTIVWTLLLVQYRNVLG